jgi:hypothetical protein
MWKLEEFKKLFKESPSTVLTVLFAFALIGGPSPAFHFSKTENNSTASSSSINSVNILNKNEVYTGKVAGDEDSPDLITEISQSQKEGPSSDVYANWNTTDKWLDRERDDQGKNTEFFCARENNAYTARYIFYKEKMPIGSSINIVYKLKSNNRDLAYSPKLIFVYGRKEEEDKDIFRIFFPDGDKENKSIGLEDNSGMSNQKRTPNRLTRSMDAKQETQIMVKLVPISGDSNEANFVYTVKYFALPEDGYEDIERVPVSGSFKVRLPWVNPVSEKSNQTIGIGVFTGDCFRLIDYTIDKSEKISS